MDLKAAVEEQIDIILKLEDERKALLRENKVFKEKNKELTVLVNKYSVKPQSSQVQTQTVGAKAVGQSVQTQVQPPSQLEEAKELLSCLNKTQLKVFQKERVQPAKKKSNNDDVLSSEIVKMSKQINSLRKDLKDSLNIIKNKEKELKETKKCLDLKSQLLQKSRTQFNELSILVNTDKYKSVRTLQQQQVKQRETNRLVSDENRMIKLEHGKMISLNDKLKSALENLAVQYETFKQKAVSEKQEQSQTNQTMRLLVDKYKEQAREYERNQRQLEESLRVWDAKQ